jgi:hypothetical protein
MTGSPVLLAEGMAVAVLASDHQRIVSVLESEAGRAGLGRQQLAVSLGLEAVQVKVEALRSKTQRVCCDHERFPVWVTRRFESEEAGQSRSRSRLGCMPSTMPMKGGWML